MVQYTRRTDDKASDMMWDSCLGGGGPYVHCSCGKDHSISAEEEESEDYEGFNYSEIDGQIFVDGCDGCAIKLRRYEDFIWNNKDNIRRYLKTRVDQEFKWAEQQKLLNKIASFE